MKKPPKLYLSKSNLCNPDDIIAVRKILQGFDLEVVEYTGGGYTHSSLVQCDMLLVLPASFRDKNGLIMVGKGQYEQIAVFMRKHPTATIWIVTDYNLGDSENSPEVYVDELLEIHLVEDDWKVNYAELETNDACISLINYDGVYYRSTDTTPPHSKNAEELVAFLQSSDDIKPMLACSNLKKKRK